MADKKVFTNTYITGKGRQNYLRIDNLEDPLFTSFTFDVDFIASPLFYTISNGVYTGDAKGIAANIETALKETYKNMKEGYDILPVNSAFKLGDDKLGFGIQQNVYMDKPIYGAVEYIYMVDKRNGTNEQNDVTSVGDGGTVSLNGSYNLGNSVNDVVNESDKKWAENKLKQAQAQKTASEEIMKAKKGEHTTNETNVNTYQSKYESKKYETNKEGKKIDKEKDLQDKINKHKKFEEEFNNLKKDIADWVNGEIKNKQKTIEDSYNNNECVKKIASYDNLSSCSDEDKQTYYDALKKEFGDKFVYKYILGDKTSSLMVKLKDTFNELVSCSNNSLYKTGKEDNNTLLIEENSSDNRSAVRGTKIVSKFKQRLKSSNIIESNATDLPEGCYVYADQINNYPEWLDQLQYGFVDFIKYCISKAKDEVDYNVDNADSICDDWVIMSKALMSYKCDVSISFVNFGEDAIRKNEEEMSKSEGDLNTLRNELYGTEDGNVCDESNPTSDSICGKYIEAKEKLENDEYSQAQKSQNLAKAEEEDMQRMLDEYNAKNKDVGDSEDDGDSNDVVNTDNTNPSGNNAKPTNVEQSQENTRPAVAPQTVLDMLGFISGMKKLINDYPYIITSITGLDIAYNKNYGIKDPYLGSGDDKITLTCFESLDLRVSSMFNRYFNAVYDRQYRRERVPVNLRRFNCSVYVHDVRKFVSRDRATYENRIFELTDMYYSVIEFRFYDCEIVPEETGNIFNDISNESPSEMKRTNFTFTYGNCIINFIPRSEIEGK